MPHEEDEVVWKEKKGGKKLCAKRKLKEVKVNLIKRMKKSFLQLNFTMRKIKVKWKVLSLNGKEFKLSNEKKNYNCMLKEYERKNHTKVLGRFKYSIS